MAASESTAMADTAVLENPTGSLDTESRESCDPHDQVLILTEVNAQQAWFVYNMTGMVALNGYDKVVAVVTLPRAEISHGLPADLANFKYFLYLDWATVMVKDPLEYLLAKLPPSQSPDNYLLQSMSNQTITMVFGLVTAELTSLLQQVQAETFASVIPVAELITCQVNRANLITVETETYLKHYSESRWPTVDYNKLAYSMFENGHCWDAAIVKVATKRLPSVCRPKALIIYPPFSTDYLEEYMSYYSVRHPPPAGWIHLNAWWTNLQCNGDQANRGYDKVKLQNYLVGLPAGKYFTLVQHDDGIYNHTLPANTVIFAAGGKRADLETKHQQICIPLFYRDANHTLEKHLAASTQPRDIFCSFIGSHTSGVRTRMVEALREYPDIKLTLVGWSTKVAPVHVNNFIDTTLRSVFALCPRGYGQTSFRFYEVMQLGAIPVYIWAEVEWLPFMDVIDYSKLCISVNVAELAGLYARLKAITPEQIAEMRAYYQTVKHYFTMEGMCQRIYEILEEMDAKSTTDQVAEVESDLKLLSVT